MPYISFSDTVAGQGSASLSGNRVYYVAYEVTVDGPRVRTPHEADGETLNGVGFVCLGNDLTAAGIVSGVGWDRELWMNSRRGQFIADGGQVASGLIRWFADHIRWSVGAGTSVRLYVLGDNE